MLSLFCLSPSYSLDKVEIKALRDSENALPAVNLTEIEPNLYQWETHGHIVIYQRKIQQRELIIAALKPQE